MAIHPTAIIDSTAELDKSVEVGPFCVIDRHVRVGAGTRLYQGVYLLVADNHSRMQFTEFGDFRPASKRSATPTGCSLTPSAESCRTS